MFLTCWYFLHISRKPTCGCQRRTEMEDAPDLAQGYISTLSLVRIIIKLGILIYFTLHETPSAWKCVVAMPTLMFVWAALRNPSFMEASDIYDEKRGNVLRFVQESWNIYDLVSNESYDRIENNILTTYFPEPWKEPLGVKCCVESDVRIEILQPLI